MREREGLSADEGVDQGSARQSEEGLEGSPAPGGPSDDVSEQVGAASPGPVAAGVPHRGGQSGGTGDALGAPPRGAAVGGEQAGEPVDMESQESRRVRKEKSPGQEYSTGEG